MSNVLVNLVVDDADLQRAFAQALEEAPQLGDGSVTLRALLSHPAVADQMLGRYEDIGRRIGVGFAEGLFEEAVIRTTDTDEWLLRIQRAESRSKSELARDAIGHVGIPLGQHRSVLLPQDFDAEARLLFDLRRAGLYAEVSMVDTLGVGGPAGPQVAVATAECVDGSGEDDCIDLGDCACAPFEVLDGSHAVLVCDCVD